MPIDLSGMSELLNRLQAVGGNVKQAEEKALKKGGKQLAIAHQPEQRTLKHGSTKRARNTRLNTSKTT